MSNFVTPLKELYAKGEKVWEYANEWNSNSVADYKNTENIFGYDDGNKVYIVYGLESNIFVAVHDANSGELLSKNLITDNLYDYFHAIVNDKKIYIAQNVSKTQSSVLVFDLLENKLIDDYVTPDLFTTQNYETGLTFLSVNDDGTIYVAYSKIMRKLILSDEKISVVWEVETLNDASYILLDNNDLYVLSNTKKSTFYKYNAVDGDLISSTKLETDSSGVAAGDIFINFFNSGDNIAVLRRSTRTAANQQSYHTDGLKLLEINKNSFFIKEKIICSGDFKKGSSGFCLEGKYYLTGLHEELGAPTRLYPGRLMKSDGNSTHTLASTSEFYNGITPVTPTTNSSEKIYTLFFLGLREHAYYVNKNDGILRKRKLAKGGIFLNDNLN